MDVFFQDRVKGTLFPDVTTFLEGTWLLEKCQAVRKVSEKQKSGKGNLRNQKLSHFLEEIMAQNRSKEERCKEVARKEGRQASIELWKKSQSNEQAVDCFVRGGFGMETVRG
jgi:hypothetical protein